MININLLPKEIADRQRFKEITTVIIFFSVLIISVLILIYTSKRIVLINLNNQLYRLEKELKKMEPIVKEVEQLKSNKAALELRKGLVEKLISTGVIYPKLMSDLVKVLPEDVWFSNMNTAVVRDQNSPDKKFTGITVMLTCSCYDKISIADFLSNLENSDKFQNVKLGPINITQQDKYELHNFTVEFLYKLQ